MTENVRTQAATALAEIEKVTAMVLPEPGTLSQMVLDDRD